VMSMTVAGISADLIWFMFQSPIGGMLLRGIPLRDHMDVGPAFVRVGQDGFVGAAMGTSSGRGLQRGVADHAQSHAGHGRRRSAAAFGRSRTVDDACLCGERNDGKTGCREPGARWVNGVLANVKRVTSGRHQTVK